MTARRGVPTVVPDRSLPVGRTLRVLVHRDHHGNLCVTEDVHGDPPSRHARTAVVVVTGEPVVPDPIP